jgi:hypothetical protein
MEFALAAPILLTLSLGVYDITRALLVWQQINNAAEAIVEAAEKLSLQNAPTGTATLSPAQIQQAMSTVYAQMPGLFPDRLTSPFGSIFLGPFGVTLSSVEFAPLCNPYAKLPCNSNNVPTQYPFTVWSSYLTLGSGNSHINLMVPQPNDPLLRPCSPDGQTHVLKPVAQFPNTVPDQFTDMVDANLQTGNKPIVLVSQLVADVQYSFVPAFPLFSKLMFSNLTFIASAALPTPVGQTDAVVTLVGNSQGNTNPVACPPIVQQSGN